MKACAVISQFVSSSFATLNSNKLMKDDGDINQSAEAKALREPPDILLTTPESLEGRM